MDLLLKRGHLINPADGQDTVADILIKDGNIEKIGTGLSAGKKFETIDLQGKIVAPGFIDMHVHLREPGYEYKETIETGTRAAAAGGFTAVCCMPNTNPPVDDAAVVKQILEQSVNVNNSIVDVYPIACVTKGRAGKELAPMMELAQAGAVAFSDDGSPVESAELMRRAMEYAGMLHRPIIQHAEDLSLTKGGAMNEGFVSTTLGLPPIPRIAEEIMIARDLSIVAYTGGQYHVAHVSTAEGVEQIRLAKKRGLPVTCEVAPHHFALTDEVVRSYDTNTKMNPPLRTQDDVEAIKDGLQDGTIDVIATDHAPHSYDEKQVEFAYAPFGIVGLETAVGLAIRELVVPEILSIEQLIEKFTLNPRRILHLPIITIEEGARANITIVDPDVNWTVDIKQFRSKSKNSPFHGWSLRGRAVGVCNNNALFMQ